LSTDRVHRSHREEGQFDIRIELSAEFDEDYAGDADGYAWLESWRARIRPEVARAVMTVLRSDPRASAVPSSRGKSPDDELVIAVRIAPADSQRASEESKSARSK
jgi:hypothetical protein